jgi:hypothetical protein
LLPSCQKAGQRPQHQSTEASDNSLTRRTIITNPKRLLKHKRIPRCFIMVWLVHQ